MRIFLCLFLLLCASIDRANAQAWPQRPIRMIIPFAAGGSADMFARMIIPKMTASLGQPIVIENRGGAGGVLGIDAVAKSTPDGYTVGLVGMGALVLAPHLTKVPYSIADDITYITMVTRVPNVLTVNNALGVATIAELVAAAQRSPGKLNYGSAGNGSTLHLAGELFRQEANINIVHVPYKGVAPAITDLLAGQVQILIGNVNVMVGQIKGGKIKALAVTSTKRTGLLPDVPTMAEAGMPSMTGEDVYGLIAPAKLPQDVLRKLATAGTAAAAAPDVAETFAQQGALASPTTPEEYRQSMLSDSAKWAIVIKRGNITSD
jgi:tripartite-type tricarboxylate transporter receptor subunit TctC